MNSFPSIPFPATGCTSPKALATIRQTHTSDLDAHLDQLHDWELRYEQLDSGRFQGDFVDIRWPGLQVFVEKTTRRVRQRGNLMPDSYGAATMVSGNGQVVANGVRADVGSLITCFSTELDVCTPPECTLAGVVVQSDLLHKAAEHVPALRSMLRPGWQLPIQPHAPALALWRALLLDAAQAVAQRPELLQDEAVRRRLHDDILTGLVEAMTTSACDDLVPGADQRKRIVDRACELLLAQPDDAMSLLEVCKRVGVSSRKLGYCFQAVLGLSPARYIKAVRLNAARRELSRTHVSSQSVYDVAARWGFWHFGHFSADYKRHFHELPSETLRRGRERLSN
jgi:AraC family ethanolamine operon transcriptional activator